MNTPLPSWQTHGGSGPHLLLVHGFLSSSAQWQLNLDALSSVCQPVTVNLFGHAGGPSPDDPSCYHPDYYVSCFETIRRELGAQRWCLLGYSLGAGLTLRYAINHPQQVICHLFTNSTSGFADAQQSALWRAAAPEAAARIRAGGISAMERIPVHPKHAWRLPAPVRDSLLRDAAVHDPNGIARTLEITNPAATMRAGVAQNSRPACLLYGEKEKRFRPHMEFAQQAMPALEIIRLDAGHGMNMEAPDAFNAAVIDFICRCAT